MKGLLAEIWAESRKQKWDVKALREQQQGEGVNLPGQQRHREQIGSLRQWRRATRWSFIMEGLGYWQRSKQGRAGREFSGLSLPLSCFPDTSSHWLAPN